MLAIATTSMTISLVASKSVKQANDHTINAVNNTEAMIDRLKKLADCPECEPYTSTLKRLSDDLRFTDTSKIVAEDGEISNLITTLEVEISCMNDSSHDKIKSLLVRLKTLIAQRQISLNAANKGKI